MLTRPDAETSSPLSLAEIMTIFAPFAQRNIVIAVSGGPDSVALMGMAAQWVRQAQPKILVHVATVNHELRPESAAEALQVGAAAAVLGLPHHHLIWDGLKPKTGIQAAARTARYRLLTRLAVELNAVLLTAHTLDDQAETIFFRLLRGSGLSGLSGMRPLVIRDAVMHCRPLLHVSKARLIATCAARGWSFVHDPSNVNPAFARSRMRQILPLLAPEGLTATTLSRLGERMAKAEAAVEAQVDTVWPLVLVAKEQARVEFDLGPALQQPVLVLERLLQRALSQFDPDQALRLERIEHYVAELTEALQKGATLRRSLGRCICSLNRNGHLIMTPAGVRRRGMQRN